jgi:CrcB protein
MGAAFPLGTFAVNLLGCAIFGLIAGIAIARPGAVSVEARVFLLTGILGGFTTFSSFGYETVELLRAGQVAFALVNVGIQVVFGLAAVWSGIAVARAVS